MRHPDSQAFHDVLAEMGLLHNQKQADYGRTDDPFANIRASEDFGIPAWVGCMTRANDKMVRLQKAARGGTMVNDSTEDDFIDLAVYAAIGLVLYRETTGGPGARYDHYDIQDHAGIRVKATTPAVDMGWPKTHTVDSCDCGDGQ